MGATCSCNCARTTPETVVDEEATPLTHGPKGRAGGALEEVKVPPGADGSVPVLAARFRVLQQGWRSCDHQRGLLRFDGAPQSEGPRTPDRSVGGDCRAGIGWTPRDSPPPTARDIDSEAEVYYEGAYLNAKRHGVGTLRMQACTYVGDFSENSKHGAATLTWDDGRVYRGQFRQGMFHGSAVMTWPDGRRYDGHYAENQKHGDGTFTWQDGRRYEGQWVGGKRHGVGTYTNAKGLSRCGTWEKDRPVSWQSEAAAEAAEAAEAAAAVAIARAAAGFGGRKLPAAKAADDSAIDVTNL